MASKIEAVAVEALPDVDPGSRPRYGLDAPGIQIGLAAASILGLIGFIASTFFSEPWLPQLRSALLWMACWCGASALAMFWGSRVGKLKLRDRVVGGIPWRGDEQVLDVGCGHGLMLLAAARQLSGGRAVGIDIWRGADQAGNSRRATLRNAVIEGVADRVELIDADMRHLPFPDASFDVVLSSWAIHNVPDQEGRTRAIREIARVLKPGGRLRIVDIRHASEYAATLRALGWSPVELSGPNFLFVIPTRTLSATRPL